jgi:SAM-dependent methyltransferase
MLRQPRFPITRLSDGRAMVNLGSNARVAAGWNNVDFSWLLRLGKHPRLSALLHAGGLVSADRYARMQRLDGNIVVWDLRKGIPFPDGAFDVAYHSHLLEHIDREAAPAFLRECQRVLRPEGIIRVVVPDLELLARRYVEALDGPLDEGNRRLRAEAVEGMIDQMVLRTPRGRAQEPLVVRALERALIGDTARAGVLHRWMYDRVSLTDLLESCGFAGTRLLSPDTSGIAGWAGFGLDTQPDGRPWMPNSLYIEATRE